MRSMLGPGGLPPLAKPLARRRARPSIPEERLLTLLNARQLRAEIARLTTALHEEARKPNPDRGLMRLWDLRRERLKEQLWSQEMNATAARWR
ncbi:hypothetical protein [Caulobacter sp. BE264]|uniref:hypothetical protein n=1 Tax=Caulobacter sp. BE264 TaxID=2817724 RepID=UPI00286C1BC1|nr:hypothetical protein [Caulobacter sp. BE264]